MSLVAMLPLLVRIPVGRKLLKARADAILAPASVEFNDLIVGWNRPTEIHGVLLKDKAGTTVLASDVANFDWSLWQIVFAPPNRIELIFPRGVLDVTRLDDGKVNLFETLEPILRDKPERDLIIEIPHGQLTVNDRSMPEPFVAESADIRLKISADPGPVTWDVKLAKSKPPGRIEVSGIHTRPADRVAGNGDTQFSVKVDHWPWKMAAQGVSASGNLDAAVEVSQKAGRMVSSGTLAVRDLLANENVRLETARLVWDLSGDKDLWTLRRLELSAPLASVAATDGELTLSVDAKYAPPADQLTIGGFTLVTPYGRLGGSGGIDQMRTSPRLDLKGSLDPDWSLIQSALVRQVEPKARIVGRSRGWTLSGPVGKSGAGLTGDFGVQLDELDVFGMKLGTTALVVRSADGRVRVDPIETQLNQGRLHIEPEIVRQGDGSYRIIFGPATTLENAIINDEVSRRVLTFAAPVLDGATRVQGRVSVKRVDAEVPLLAAKDVHARVEGDVLFDDVRFMPGPLANELLNLLPNVEDGQPLLTLRDPVSLRITEGKVYQHGLKIPLTKLGAVAVDGSVDFQRKLDLVAKFTLNPPQAADKPALTMLLKTARLEVPVKGTLDEPKIDAQAMQDRLKTVGADLLQNSVGIGAEGLIRLFEGIAARRQARLADPDRPAPLSPAERREIRQERRRERQEKKAERRNAPKE